MTGLSTTSEKTTLYLPVALKRRINEVAGAERRSATSQVLIALEHYFLDETETASARIQETPASPSPKTITPHRGGGQLPKKPASTSSRQTTKRKSSR